MGGGLRSGPPSGGAGSTSDDAESEADASARRMCSPSFRWNRPMDSATPPAASAFAGNGSAVLRTNPGAGTSPSAPPRGRPAPAAASSSRSMSSSARGRTSLPSRRATKRLPSSARGRDMVITLRRTVRSSISPRKSSGLRSVPRPARFQMNSPSRTRSRSGHAASFASTASRSVTSKWARKSVEPSLSGPNIRVARPAVASRRTR